MSRANTFQSKYGPWAVVTGASDGIGRAFADALARRRINLVIVARRRERLLAVAQELSQKHGVATETLDLDLAKRGAIEALDNATAALDVGVLIAAAGFGTSGHFLDASLAEEYELLDVNIGAVMALSHLFTRRLVRRGHGGLILMSSLLAFQGVPLSANYAATKAYVQTLAEGLYLECKRFGIDVIACAPGPVRSGFEARANMRMSVGQKPDGVAEATLRALGRRSTVRPGLLSKALESSLAPLPRNARSRILGQVMASMTRHQSKPRTLEQTN